MLSKYNQGMSEQPLVRLTSITKEPKQTQAPITPTAFQLRRCTEAVFVGMQEASLDVFILYTSPLSSDRKSLAQSAKAGFQTPSVCQEQSDQLEPTLPFFNLGYGEGGRGGGGGRRRRNEVARFPAHTHPESLLK